MNKNAKNYILCFGHIQMEHTPKHHQQLLAKKKHIGLYPKLIPKHFYL